MTEWHLLSYICSGSSYRRAPHPTLKAKDGRRIAALVPDFLGPHVFDHLLQMLEDNGVAGPLSDPAFRDPGYRAANYNELWQALKRLAADADGEAVYRMGQSAGLPWGVIRSPDEVLDDPHLQARGHFVTLEHPELAGDHLMTQCRRPSAGDPSSTGVAVRGHVPGGALHRSRIALGDEPQATTSR